MNLREILWQLLAWGILPAWLAAGAADWLCHRRAHIADTSGPRESLLHLLLYAEIVLPVMLALWFDISAGLLAVMAAGVVAHLFTSWWDTAYAQPRRRIAPIEQQVHSWLEMLPLFALLIVAVLHADQFARPDWSLDLREPAMPAASRNFILGVLAAGLVPIVEELLRGLRESRRRGS
jgi:hypothetical protein